MPTIAVTGHRVLLDPDPISAGIDVALSRIEQRFPNGPIQLLSCLAEGADRLVVRLARGRPRMRKLIVVLPFREEEYVRDFRDPAARAEYEELKSRAAAVVTLSGTEIDTRPGSYSEAGHYLLSRADVLLAVWDGQPARGRGGTGEIVADARRRGFPLAWVYAGNALAEAPGVASQSTPPGTVRLERF